MVGPQTDDFVRNRLTHSLEVAQVARDLSRALGSQPDIAETAALAHDLGHPPFGHNGERALAELSEAVRRLRGQRPDAAAADPAGGQDVDADGRSVGLNLTRATLDACTKYPWRRARPERARRRSPRSKFGVYDDDLPVFDWLRDGRRRAPRRCLEAQVMDLADDVAYSVHDVEDGVVAGRVDLTALDRAGGVGDGARLVPARRPRDDELDEVLAGLRTSGSWPTGAVRRQPAAAWRRSRTSPAT